MGMSSTALNAEFILSLSARADQHGTHGKAGHCSPAAHIARQVVTA